MDAGFTAFKIKVGQNLKDDIKRLAFIRNIIGWDRILVGHSISKTVKNNDYLKTIFF